MDVTFREDACRARKDYSATNLNTLRKFALAIVSGHKRQTILTEEVVQSRIEYGLPQKATKDLMRLPWGKISKFVVQ
ncbi:hypothetical protein CS544_05550 [Porphyromonas gingivalis]|nr:hypothetical protein CS544_05550 [Porphyromonas gingivalis]